MSLCTFSPLANANGLDLTSIQYISLGPLTIVALENENEIVNLINGTEIVSAFNTKNVSCILNMLKVAY